MIQELEITFTDVDHNILIKKLIELWAQCIQEKTLMKRIVFRSPSDSDNSFFRLRDEGNKITFTYKHITQWDKDIRSVKELETEVQNFETMKQMLLLTWLEIKAYQESYRETWQIEDTFFMLDIWPWIQPFIEIEWESEDDIKHYSSLLWFDFHDWLFGTIDELYFLELGIPHKVTNIAPEITFENPPKKYISFKKV